MFCSSCEDDMSHAGLDHSHTRNHRFHAGGTHPIDGDRRDVVRNARHQGPDTRHIEGICRLDAAAVADILDHFRLNSRPFHCLLHRDARNGGGVHIFKGSTKSSNGSTTRRSNNHILHN
jgi:hypothetical protein